MGAASEVERFVIHDRPVQRPVVQHQLAVYVQTIESAAIRRGAESGGEYHVVQAG